MQIEPRYVNLTETCFVAPPEKIAAACDKNTIGVVGILGTTYSGHYEDVAGIDAEISEPHFPCPLNDKLGSYISCASPPPPPPPSGQIFGNIIWRLVYCWRKFQSTDPYCGSAGKLNDKNGWDIKIHIDGASGAFVVPFLYPDLKWDFRLKNVVSINASGHKCALSLIKLCATVSETLTGCP